MDAREVPQAISDALDAGRIEVTRHFWDELREDAFVLADVRCALEAVSKIVPLGEDRAGNPKFEVSGMALDGRLVSVVCSFKPTGAVLLITVYEG